MRLDTSDRRNAKKQSLQLQSHWASTAKASVVRICGLFCARRALWSFATEKPKPKTLCSVCARRARFDQSIKRRERNLLYH